MLVAKDINYTIDGKRILNDASLQLEQGEHCLIHGPSGCGKSTLMHIMAGLLKATSGTVQFQDNDYNTLTTSQLNTMRRTHFGFVFQKMHLIGHLTARQNIELVKTTDFDDRIIDDLNIVNVMDRKATSLSVGEAQRVALARALANKPSIIFADEPTSALDEDNANNVVTLLLKQAQKHDASLVITSHDKRIFSHFDHQLALDKDAQS